MGNEEMTFSIGEDGTLTKYEEPYSSIECKTEEDYNRLLELLEKGKNAEKLNTIEEWNEDDGNCLWWRFPIEEPPYCGTPLDCNFPDNITHFTRLTIPKESK